MKNPEFNSFFSGITLIHPYHFHQKKFFDITGYDQLKGKWVGKNHFTNSCKLTGINLISSYKAN
jgi:hypothetical protein